MRKLLLFISALFIWLGVFSQGTPPHDSAPLEMITDTVYPVNMIDGTGYITSYLTSSPFLKKGPGMNVSRQENDTLGRGYFKFDITTLQANAVITQATLNYYCLSKIDQYGDPNSVFSLVHDPTTTSGSTLYYDCGNGAPLWSDMWGEPGQTGPFWVGSELNSTGIEYISDQMAAGWAGFGLVSAWGDFFFAGYNDPVYKPYLVIEYYIPTGPSLCVSPVNHVFEDVNLGIQSLPQSFKIKNLGIGTLTIDAVAIFGVDSGQFILTDNATYPKNLGAGQSYTVSVAFYPTSVGNKTAVLVVNENDNDNIFDLSGKGYLNGPQNLTATPVFGPYVDLAWAPPLPLQELRNDHGFSAGSTLFLSTTTSVYWFARITIPVDGMLTNIGVCAEAYTVPGFFESVSLCPDLNGFPDLANPIQSFANVQYTSRRQQWALETLTPFAVTGGQDFYVVAQAPNSSVSPPGIGFDYQNNSFRSGFTRNGGLSWVDMPGDLLMRAYMAVTGDNISTEPIVLVSGVPVEGSQNLPRINPNVHQKALTEMKVESVMAPAVIAPYHTNASTTSNYTVHRGISWQNLPTTFTGISGTTFQDTTTAPTTTYYYMVSYEYPNGIANSNTASVRTFEICPVPTTLSANNITTTSADLGWTPNGTTAWELEWGPMGFEQGSGTMDSTGVTNPYPLSGLTSGTYYDIYVRSKCDSSSFSSWTGPFTFSTWCQNSDVPYSENFDSYMEPFTGCVTVTNENAWSGTIWSTVSYGSLSDPNHIEIYNQNTVVALDDWFFTPGLNLLSGTLYDVNFFYRNTGGSWATEKLEVKWGNFPSRAGMIGPQVFNDANIKNLNYIEGTGTFAVPSDGVYYLGWHGYSDQFNSGIAVDDITIDVTPSCYKPKNVAVSNVGVTTVTVSWTPSISEPANGYEYEIRTDGPGGSGNIGLAAYGSTAAGVVTANVSGLAAFTTYHVYVRSNCDSTGYSVWSSMPPTMFTTLCDFTTIPYAENFDSYVPPSAGCVTVADDNGDGNYWSTTEYFSLSAPNSIALPTYGDSNDDWFFSPGLYLTGGTSYDVNFWYAGDGYTPEKLEVKYGTIPTAIGMTSDQIFNNDEILNGNYIEAMGTFTAPVTAVYYVGWHGYSDMYSDFISVDDISIDVTPSCYKPKDVAIYSVSFTTANISWTAPISSPEDGYEYEVRTGGEPGSGSVGLAVSGVTGAGVVIEGITGLTPAMNYYVYVRSNCGLINGYSAWSFPAGTFNTLCEPFSMPYSENFDTYAPPSTGCVTVSNNNFDGSQYQWYTSDYLSMSPPNSIVLNTSGDYPSDDWFFTPGLNLIAGRTYNMKFWYLGSGYAPEKLEVKWGGEPFAQGMTGGQIFANEEIANDYYIEATAVFTAPATGVYYIGWHAYSDSYSGYISIDDISVELVPLPFDLTVTGSVVDPENNCYNATNVITVEHIAEAQYLQCLP
ncbi:MAG: fibronectin type III domain-containing protein [Bacteroidetes bacterium]|nr:fibronectin type III domain-containing protein [Bacteroidota bacterium]